MKCCLEHIKQFDLDYKLLFIVFIDVLVFLGVLLNILVYLLVLSVVG